MTVPISICRGCFRPIVLPRNVSQAFRPSNRTVRFPRWLQPSYAQMGRRPLTTAEAKTASSTQKLKSTSELSKPAASLQVPHLSYARQLADKSSPTVLYEAGPQRVFLFSSYAAGFFFVGTATINYWLNVLHVPADIHWAVPIAFSATTVAMVAFAVRFALIPGGSIRSIKLSPRRSAKSTAQAQGAKAASPVGAPVRLQIEARRNLPIPGLPLRRFEADINNVTMAAPLYNRKKVPSGYEKMLMEQEEEAKRKKQREYEMDHIMTAPFRHAIQVFGGLFKSFRRGLTGEGFAPITIDGVKYKLDITSAYVLDEGRALDRIVRIEEDPVLARYLAKKQK